MVKQQYKTEQRKDLLDYMKNNTNKFVKVEDIEKYLKKKDISIGLTTIYRFLNSLEKQGKVRVEFREHTKYYQYILEECNNHFHLQCKKCGKIVHLHCEEIEELKLHIAKEHKFEIDSMATIMGMCADCRNTLGVGS